MIEELDQINDFQRVVINRNNSSMTSLHTNAFQWNPMRYTQMPVLVPPLLGCPFPVGFPMKRFPYNCNSNRMFPVIPVPNTPNMDQPMPMPKPMPRLPSQMVSNGINNSNDLPQKELFCRLCSSFSSRNLKVFKDHLYIHSPPDRPFVCQICDKVFHYRCLWRNHIVIHMAVKRPYPLKYGENQNQIDTNNGKHCKEISYKCEECGYTSKSKTDWEKHLRLNCSTCPLKCTECEYETYTRIKLERHESTHIRSRPFACVKCHSTFSQSGSLKGHLIKVHKIAELMVCCSHCPDFKVKNFGHLKTHIQRVHENKPFKYTLV